MTSPVERNQIVPRITRMKPMRIVIFDALLVILLVLCDYCSLLLFPVGADHVWEVAL